MHSEEQIERAISKVCDALRDVGLDSQRFDQVGRNTDADADFVELIDVVELLGRSGARLYNACSTFTKMARDDLREDLRGVSPGDA